MPNPISHNKYILPPSIRMKSLLSPFSSSVVAAEPRNDKDTINPIRQQSHLILNMFDVWVIGLAAVINGPTLGWNAGVSVGFGAFVMMQFIMMIAYVILACSLGEMIGTTLFSGGSYGIARVTLGFYGGFMIGALELLEHIVFTATAL